MGEVSVSAVVPLYNGAEFIAEALDSIMRQSEPPAEIIVVNDGSSDDGPAIVEKIAARQGALPLVLLHKENGGQSSARNLGVDRCKGTHVAFLDQDDIWYEDHIEVLSSELKTSDKRKQPALVYGNLDQIDRAGRMVLRNLLNHIAVHHPKESLMECLRDDVFMLPSASLFSVDALKAVGEFDERLSGYEDDDLFVRLFCAGYALKYVDRAVTKWRIYPNSSSFSPRMALSRIIYYRKLIEMFPNEPGLVTYWVRDLIAPRFFRQFYLEFLAASREQNAKVVESIWPQVLETAAGLHERRYRKLKRIAPLVELTSQVGAFSAGRFLLRRSVKTH